MASSQSQSSISSSLVDSKDELKTFLDTVKKYQGSSPPALYIDLEGHNLSRHGTISLVTILLKPQNKVYLLDVTKLKSSAFSITGKTGLSLKQILESTSFIKVFFDIRHDSDALFGLYGVRVAGIEDLQLFELASRQGPKQRLKGLAKCVEQDAQIPRGEKIDWENTKKQGRRLFDPNAGGSYKVFDQRPLPAIILKYCCQDVTLMPQLRTIYHNRLDTAWLSKIRAETKARITLSQSSTFDGKNARLGEGPRNWWYWQPPNPRPKGRNLDGARPALDPEVEFELISEALMVSPGEQAMIDMDNDWVPETELDRFSIEYDDEIFE